MNFKKPIKILIDGCFYDAEIEVPVYFDYRPESPIVIITENKKKRSNINIKLMKFLRENLKTKQDFEIYYEHKHVANLVGTFPKLIDLSFKHIILIGDYLDRII
jgi:hypothetical protein